MFTCTVDAIQVFHKRVYLSPAWPSRSSWASGRKSRAANNENRGDQGWQEFCAQVSQGTGVQGHLSERRAQSDTYRREQCSQQRQCSRQENSASGERTVATAEEQHKQMPGAPELLLRACLGPSGTSLVSSSGSQILSHPSQ